MLHLVVVADLAKCRHFHRALKTIFFSVEKFFVLICNTEEGSRWVKRNKQKHEVKAEKMLKKGKKNTNSK